MLNTTLMAELRAALESNVCTSRNVEDLSVELSLPAHGYGSATTKVSRISADEYLVEDVLFSMSGEWDLVFQKTFDR